MITRFPSSVFRRSPAWNPTWLWCRAKAEVLSFRPHLIAPLVLMCSLLTTAEIPNQGNIHVDDDAWVLTGTNQDQDANFAPVIANGFIGSVIPALGSAYKNKAGRHMLDGYYVGATPKEVKVPIQRWNCVSFNNGVNDCAPKVGQLSDYQQQLNLRHGTVETRYRWSDSGKSADIRIVSFASRNEPNLAVIRYSVTPGFDGPAAFKVALDGRDSGSRITGSGEANQVIWMLDSAGKPTNLEVAAAVKAVYTGCDPELRKDGDLREFIQTASFVAAKGTTYTVTAFVAVVKKGDPWEMRPSSDSVAEACKIAGAAAKAGWESAYTSHCQAWENYWKTDIQIEGSGPEVAHYQKVIRTCLYNLVSTTRPDGVFGLDACGFMQAGWNGSMFWDSDFFMRPVLQILHPELSLPALRYRVNRLKAAMENAKLQGFEGADYPWQQRYSGAENTRKPYEREIHVNGCIVWSVWMHYQLTRDLEWLKKDGWPVIREVANFIVTQAVERNGRWEVLNVVSPDEYNTKADNDAFTNAVFQRALQIGGKATALLGEQPDKLWKTIADGMYIPFDAARQLYLECDGFTTKATKQAATEMLIYPLEMPMSDLVKRNTLDYYGSLVDRKAGPAMTQSFYAIGYSELGDKEKAYAAFKDSIDLYVRAPFHIFTETPRNPLTDMTTGKAAMLTGVINGFAGLRVRDDGVHFKPALPKEWSRLTITHLPVGAGVYDITIAGDQVQARLVSGTPDIALFDRDSRNLRP